MWSAQIPESETPAAVVTDRRWKVTRATIMTSSAVDGIARDRRETRIAVRAESIWLRQRLRWPTSGYHEPAAAAKPAAEPGGELPEDGEDPCQLEAK
jgi:hypothetical protein